MNPIVEELLHARSCSVVGMEKNTGKTVCLNYLLAHLPASRRVAVTSIGLDGESRDQVTGTHKPEIRLRPGVLFATSETHYRQRRLGAEILDVSHIPTALGRLVTARVITEGKTMLSGPGATEYIREWMDSLDGYVDLILIDGALSRMSLASPTVSETMILATGAACSANIDTLVRKTAYQVELINLPLYVSGESEPIAINGAVTDRVLEQIMNDPKSQGKDIVIPDFTKIFADSMLWHRFVRSHRVSVRRRSRLIGVTVNPTAPNGMVLDSDILTQRLSEAIGLPVYDLLKE